MVSLGTISGYSSLPVYACAGIAWKPASLMGRVLGAVEMPKHSKMPLANSSICALNFSMSPAFVMKQHSSKR